MGSDKPPDQSIRSDNLLCLRLSSLNEAIAMASAADEMDDQAHRERDQTRLRHQQRIRQIDHRQHVVVTGASLDGIQGRLGPVGARPGVWRGDGCVCALSARENNI